MTEGRKSKGNGFEFEIISSNLWGPDVSLLPHLFIAKGTTYCVLTSLTSYICCLRFRSLASRQETQDRNVRQYSPF